MHMVTHDAANTVNRQHYWQVALHAGNTHIGSYTQVILDACDYTHVVLFTDGTACSWHYTQHYRQVALHAGDTPFQGSH